MTLFEHTCTVKHSECGTLKTLRLNRRGGEREGRQGRKEEDLSSLLVPFGFLFFTVTSSNTLHINKLKHLHFFPFQDKAIQDKEMQREEALLGTRAIGRLNDAGEELLQ